jgi:hypothetical protein
MTSDQQLSAKIEDTLAELLKFPLMEALIGRRSRRFCMGSEIPDGVFAFKSKYKPLPLSEIEQMLLLSTMGGVTGWHFAIMRHKKYAPYLSNYCNSPSGRTFPSAAGFCTSEIFYTDDNGTYFFPTRDFHPPLDIMDGKVDLQEFLAAHKSRIRKISDKRLYTPKEEPYMEGHNTWIANHEGSTLVIPVGDLAQHTLSAILYYTVNHLPIFDDIVKKQIPGIDKYDKIVDTKNPIPLTYLEQYNISAIDALINRKFGEGGMYNVETPGAWKDSAKVRGSANPITEEIKECAALQAQYIYDTYGKFPATIPSIFLLTYLQAQHIDLDFYDHYFKPGAYLTTHKNHIRKWHDNSSSK